jgi:hypothetical protein
VDNFIEGVFIVEEILAQFTGYGVTGIVAYKLFVTFLSEKEEDKKAYKAELKELRELYKVELSKDRELYEESMKLIVNKLEALERDIVEIKENIEKK